MEENKAYTLKKYSYADLEKMDDDNRYEIIDGELYLMSSPSTKHQMVAGEIYAQLNNFLKGKKCTPFISPLDVIFSETKKEDEIFNVVQPDVFVVCDEIKIEDKYIFGAPDFIVEVLSPSNERHDMLTKMMLYQRYKVKEYWIIDTKQEIVIPYVLNKDGVYQISDRIYDLEEEIPVKVLSGCVISLRELYQENPGIREDIHDEYKCN